MKYEKPEIIAQNAEEGTYAAGCPTTHRTYNPGGCTDCELTQQFLLSMVGTTPPYKTR